MQIKCFWLLSFSISWRISIYLKNDIIKDNYLLIRLFIVKLYFYFLFSNA